MDAVGPRGRYKLGRGPIPSAEGLRVGSAAGVLQLGPASKV